MAKKISFFLVFVVLLAACSPQSRESTVTATVIADGTSKQVSLITNSSVQQALNSAGITLSQTDRVDPPIYAIVSNGLTIKVTRVTEKFETRQVIIPYERQELHNESLPAGETRLIQAGQNGLKELTIRHVYEDGVETGSSTVSDTILQAPLPEIEMIGVQSPFAPLVIPGKLVYLTSGNAWIMVDSTSNRYPLVTTGDLDGRIFSLSPDGKWLLFSRKSTQPPEKETNTLWVVSTTVQPPVLVNLKISNVPNFAAWKPGAEYVIAYSTVEPRATAPGWQANNDLHFLEFTNGKPGRKTDILETNSGGIYGWWGMSFTWSPDGTKLAYSRPDSVGLVDITKGVLTSILNFTALNTHGDWAWSPGLAWGADGNSIYTVTHAAPTGLVSPEESPNFNLDVVTLASALDTSLVQQSGMFANPAVSSLREIDSGSTYLVAFLKAIFPAQSATSRYILDVMNSDGTNPRALFPAEGQTGLQPQTPVWAPQPLDTGADFISIVYDGNLWIVDVSSGQTQQVTGDGLTSKLDWK
jgi:resuscitation-promoting factor RpfB